MNRYEDSEAASDDGEEEGDDAEEEVAAGDEDEEDEKEAEGIASDLSKRLCTADKGMAKPLPPKSERRVQPPAPKSMLRRLVKKTMRRTKQKMALEK